MAVFALDGQHRLMGIQGLMELIKTGKLSRYNKQKKTIGKAITIDDFTKNNHIELPEIQKLVFLLMRLL